MVLFVEVLEVNSRCVQHWTPCDHFRRSVKGGHLEWPDPSLKLGHVHFRVGSLNRQGLSSVEAFVLNDDCSFDLANRLVLVFFVLFSASGNRQSGERSWKTLSFPEKLSQSHRNL